jgi:carboxymethylenebutenolidase
LDAVVIAKPETVIRWQARGFRAYWRWKSRRRGGRPRIDREIRALIRGDRLVDEFVVCFKHDTENDTLLPSIKATGKFVRIPMVAIVQFRGNKLCSEHLYWDQASVLAQLGLLNSDELPITGADQADKVLDEKLPLNSLRAAQWWKKSEGKT